MNLDRHNMHAYMARSGSSRLEAREEEPEQAGLLTIAEKSQRGDPAQLQELPGGFQGVLQKTLQASGRSRR